MRGAAGVAVRVLESHAVTPDARDRLLKILLEALEELGVVGAAQLLLPLGLVGGAASLEGVSCGLQLSVVHLNALPDALGLQVSHLLASQLGVALERAVVAGLILSLALLTLHAAVGSNSPDRGAAAARLPAEARFEAARAGGLITVISKRDVVDGVLAALL